MSAAEPKIDACRTCSICDGHPPKTDSETREIENTVSHIERLASERDSGMQIDLTQMSALEWEMLIVWDNFIEAEKRAQQVRVSLLFEALLKH